MVATANPYRFTIRGCGEHGNWRCVPACVLWVCVKAYAVCRDLWQSATVMGSEDMQEVECDMKGVIVAQYWKYII